MIQTHVFLRLLKPVRILDIIAVSSWFALYTDDSKHKDESTYHGVIIFINKDHWVTENYTLSNVQTVFQCEGHALIRASILLNDILAAPSFRAHRAIIYTDSQALIKALSNSHTISKTIYNLHHNLNTVSTNHYMSIEWVPGHTGHYGNELADKLANIRTVTQTTELETSQSPTPHAQYKQKIDSYIFNKLKKQWSNRDISNTSLNHPKP